MTRRPRGPRQDDDRSVEDSKSTARPSCSGSQPRTFPRASFSARPNRAPGEPNPLPRAALKVLRSSPLVLPSPPSAKRSLDALLLSPPAQPRALHIPSPTPSPPRPCHHVGRPLSPVRLLCPLSLPLPPRPAVPALHPLQRRLSPPAPSHPAPALRPPDPRRELPPFPARITVPEAGQRVPSKTRWHPSAAARKAPSHLPHEALRVSTALGRVLFFLHSMLIPRQASSNARRTTT